MLDGLASHPRGNKIENVSFVNMLNFILEVHSFSLFTLLFQVYENCRCIPSVERSIPYGTAKQGTCDRDCKNLIPFLFGAVVLLIFNFMNATPNKTVVLRWVLACSSCFGTVYSCCEF